MSRNTTHQPQAPGVTAVTYHRVASGHDSGHGEGSAVRGQREATRRKAAELGATVLEEFTDPGVSGRTSNRPALQQMLAYLDTHDVTYCVVGSIASLARDPFTYADIHEALTQAGVTLISCEDRAGASPSSSFVHDLMSAIAGFEAEHLSTEESDDAPMQTTHPRMLTASRTQPVHAHRPIR